MLEIDRIVLKTVIDLLLLLLLGADQVDDFHLSPLESSDAQEGEGGLHTPRGGIQRIEGGFQLHVSPRHQPRLQLDKKSFRTQLCLEEKLRPDNLLPLSGGKEVLVDWSENLLVDDLDDLVPDCVIGLMLAVFGGSLIGTQIVNLPFAVPRTFLPP